MYIFHRATVVLVLLLLTMASAMAQITVYVGETTTLSVVQQPGDTYLWELYDDPSVDFAIIPGNCPASSAIFVGGNAGASVEVQWKKEGTYFYKVTGYDITGCTMNLKIGIVEVKEAKPVAEIIQPEPNMICVGEVATLEINITRTGPWDLTITDGTNVWKETNIQETPYLFQIKPLYGAFYWITEVSNANGTTTEPSEKVWLEIKPKPVSSIIYPYEP